VPGEEVSVGGGGHEVAEMGGHLRAMFEIAREFLLGEGASRLGVLRQNCKGDVTKEFDYLAEQRILEYCARAIAEPVRLLTEERGEVRTRPGPAAWTLIVDPVDGSENFARGNEDSCVSLALLRGEETPEPREVVAALVGNIFTGTRFEAARGEGARRNGRPIRTSGRTRLAGALVAVDFNFQGAATVSRIHPLLEAIGDARRFGSAAKEFAVVADGGADAYVDVRETLTPENYMAAYLIVAEAGGVISDRFGTPLAPIGSLTQGQSIVAAATPSLHAAILGRLNGHPA
jgi:myo-inositol-1(or 4)-monophosphatase